MERHAFRQLEDLDPLLSRSVVTVGVFDGLHLGHQAILAQLVEAARTHDLPAVCVTYSVHPRAVLSDTSPEHLMSLDHRLELLAAHAVDHAVVVEFNRAFANVEAEVFVDELLVRRLGVRELVIGHDTAIGHGRRGDAAFLEAAGKRHGFVVVTVGSVTVDGCIVSSTVVREAIRAGDLERAARLLGRPMSLLGTVVRGDGRGATIGVPTANLEVRSEAFPPLGVYAVTARCAQGDFPAVMNYGMRPTFRQDEDHAVFEIHVLDRTDLALYGQRMEVFLHAFLRREQRFDSAEALVAQIRADCDTARAAQRCVLPPRTTG